MVCVHVLGDATSIGHAHGGTELRDEDGPRGDEASLLQAFDGEEYYAGQILHVQHMISASTIRILRITQRTISAMLL